MKNLLFFILFLLVSYACNVSSQEKNPENSLVHHSTPSLSKMEKQEFRQYYRKLNSFFNSTLLKTGFNGSILVAKNGTILYERYVGKIDLRNPEPITANTPIHIASTSKTFTAIAILRLVTENKLSLSDTLEQFFPGFPYHGITIKMLLSHRSGLPNYLYFMSNNKWGIGPGGKWNGQFATNNDVLKMLFEKQPTPAANPDTRFNYCNTNYVLLSLIIEKVTGSTYPDYIQHTFFDPLQMNHSYVFTLKDTETATPSFTGRNTLWDLDFLDATYGDKNIYTTPRDLLKWDQALYTNELIRPGLMDSAFMPYSLEKPSVHNYGLGWRMLLLPNGKKVIYHFGKWHGFNAAFARLTDEKATIIILGNKYNRNIYKTARLAYDLFGNYLQQKDDPEEENESPESGGNPLTSIKAPPPLRQFGK